MSFTYEEIQDYLNRRFEQMGIDPANSNMVFFWKPYPKVKGVIDAACCCQWWYSPFVFDGVECRTAEHAMMYGKAKLFNDQHVMREVLNVREGYQAKEWGRKVKGFDQQTWDNNHYQLVRDISLAKFTQNAKEREWLLSHPKNTLFVEASPFDELWGIKRGVDGTHDLTDTRNWIGKNKLGFAITEVFQTLQA